MAVGGYTMGEVVWLLSLSADDARKHDQGLGSTLAGATSTGPSSGSSDGPDLPAIVRWHDVQAARNRVVIEKRDQEIVKYRTAGMTEEEIAIKVELDQSTVNRRFRAKLREILAVLGPLETEDQVLPYPNACLSCAARPRARARSVRADENGWWEALNDERELALCAVCLPPGSRQRLMLRPHDMRIRQRSVSRKAA